MPPETRARGAPRGWPTAGVASPEHDAEELAAHVLGTVPGAGWCWLDRLPAEAAGRYGALVARRGPPGSRCST